MPHIAADQPISGSVTDIFDHRFVVQTANGKLLADLGKHNSGSVKLKSGDKVELTGEMKPSELKIHQIILNGHPIPLADKHDKREPKHHDKQDTPPADLALANQVAKEHKITPIGAPHAKPKHTELLGRTESGDLVELHIEHEGKLRHIKPVDPDSEKWQKEISVEDARQPKQNSGLK